MAVHAINIALRNFVDKAKYFLGKNQLLIAKQTVLINNLQNHSLSNAEIVQISQK